VEATRNDESSRIRPISGAGSEREAIDILSATTLLARMEEKERRVIVGCARTYSFTRDAVLFTQGQPVRSLALIRSGSVKLTQTSREGSEAIVQRRAELSMLLWRQPPSGFERGNRLRQGLFVAPLCVQLRDQAVE